MGKDSTLNMTEGSPTKLLLVFSLPMLIGNIFQQFYNLMDSVIVGRLIGANALAAIGATGSITFFFFAICNGIGSGGSIITAQFFGSGDEDKVKRCITNVAYIMTAFPIVVGIIAFVGAGPLLRLLETPEVIFDDALAYMQVCCVGLIFVSLYNYISSILRALGDSKTPLYFLVFACILNIILDVIFVKAGMGVVGAGVATLISQFLAGLLSLLFAIKFNPYFKLKKENFSIDKGIIFSSVRLGVPLSLQYSLIAISSMALQRVVNSFGDVAVAAFTATSRIEQMVHQPYQTLSAALATFCGQNYGANKKNRLITGYRKSLIIMGIFTLIIVPIMQVWGEAICSFFVDDKDVIEMGAVALKITSIFYLFLGMIYVVRGVLNGIGDAFFALFNGIVEVIGRFTVPVALTMIPAIGLWGIWWSVGVVWFLSGFTAWLRYLYMKKKVILS